MEILPIQAKYGLPAGGSLSLICDLRFCDLIDVVTSTTSGRKSKHIRYKKLKAL